MKNKKTQLEYLKDVIKLIEANPDCDIIFCVDNDELTDDLWTAQKIQNIRIESLALVDGYYFSKDDLQDNTKKFIETICIYTGAKD